MDDSILGSILGSSYFGELQFEEACLSGWNKWGCILPTKSATQEKKKREQHLDRSLAEYVVSTCNDIAGQQMRWCLLEIWDCAGGMRPKLGFLSAGRE